MTQYELISARVKYYLLDYRDDNLEMFFAKFGDKKLKDCNSTELASLFLIAFEFDNNIILKSMPENPNEQPIKAVSFRVRHYLLDYRERNLVWFINTFGDKKLQDLTAQELHKLFIHASEQDAKSIQSIQFETDGHE
jgi:hypothetical protein